MSAFECNITPTRFRNEKKRNEDREPTFVDLKPFSGRSIVTFENVPISKTARRLLIIINPFDEPLQVNVTKMPKPENNLAFEWKENQIPPQSQLNLELVWTPLASISCRETMQISDGNGNKKDVAIILKSCELKKTTSRKVAPSGYPKKLKMKTPSPPTHFHRVASAKATMRSSHSENRPPLQMSPLRNATNLRTTDLLDRIDINSCTNIFQDKENTPLTPKNVSTLFDNIRFTPLTDSKPKCESKLEYLASLPTPVLSSQSNSVVNNTVTRRRIVVSPETNVAPPLYALPTPQEKRRTKSSSQVDEINEIEIILNENTRVLSSNHLCVISEEEQITAPTEFHKTFEVNKTQSMTELCGSCSFTQATSESLKDTLKVPGANVVKLRCNQGSMPNLNDDVGSIENNRYFKQQKVERNQENNSLESLVSNADFQEIESCAQSSRLFIDDFDSPVKQSSTGETKLSRDLKPSPREKPESPSIRRIQQEEPRKTPNRKNVFVFSPPSRRETFAVTSNGQNIRATTWKQQQNQQMFAVPKVPRDLTLRSKFVTQSLSSLSTSSLASISSTCSTPAKLTTGRLYNENYMAVYNRNDPFSATTTIDPFLSSTMYLDEQNLDKIEKSYMKWLNALVTIPPDLESDVNEKIDIGKLFTEVQNKEMTLAPTKEAVVSKYYTSRLDSLRNLAVQLFHSHQISAPLNKLTVMINEKNKLDIKADRSIHLDIVLQRALLELLLCYNPLWLRIGIEVVMNVQLNLTSNRDIFGMTRFIISNLFKSPYLAEKYSKFSQKNEYLEKLRKHTVKNFLFIIFFLDRAKESRLIKQNPCLFVKKAPFKESTEILKRFASLVLANYGDIIRMLRRLDYIVNHKQTAIDEYNFAFTNLAVDLREGVRLTKVMEVILMRDDLVQKVRVPAISRLQKVYNVDLALKALEAAEYQILGNITSKDIADGHREKTLSLLWQIIYKFRAPRFNAAAITIQRFWRSKYLMIVVNRRIKAKEQEKLNRAATVIQKAFRGWKARQEIKRYREKVTASCVLIQKTVRGFILRRRLKKQISSVVCLQRWYRRVRIMREARIQFVITKTSTTVIQKWWRRQLLAKKLIAASQVIKSIKQESLVRHKAAIIIQRSIKSFVIHQKLKSVINGIVSHNRKVRSRNLAAVKIQSILRMKQQRKKFLQLKKATTKIQCWWRQKLEAKKTRQTFVEVKQCTVKIQLWFRGVIETKKQRTSFLLYRKTVITVQNRYRANLLMRQALAEYQQLKIATMTIQQQFRALQAMRSQRDQYEKLKKSTIAVQQRFRAISQMKTQRRTYLLIRTSTIVVQRIFRATLLMKKERKEYLVLQTATITIQQRFRAQKAMQIDHREYQKTRKAIITLQRRFRANQIMKTDRQQYLTLKESVIKVQKRFRANQLMKKEQEHFNNLKQSTIRIQQKFRSTMLMRKLTLEFYTIQITTVNIQRRFRANQLMKSERERFQLLKRATLVTQTRFRANQLMKTERNDFLKMKSATMKLQQWFRGILEMKKQQANFLLYRKAVINVQNRYRANLLMRRTHDEYHKLKVATVNTQRLFRAQLAMRKQRNEYTKLRKSTIVIQQRFRAITQMEVQRRAYLLIRTSTITIQRIFRATLLMRKERNEYLMLQNAALTIQQRFRAQKSMQVDHQQYQKTLSTIVTVQRRFRANQMMKVERQEYSTLKRATITVQRQFKANQLMKKKQEHFKNLKQTTIRLQQKFRSTILMRKLTIQFTTIRIVTVTIQRRFRANQLMKSERDRFQLLKKAAIVTQMRFRANQLMKTGRNEFSKMKSAAIKIQIWFRSVQLLKIDRINYVTLKRTVLIVENRILANQSMQIERSKFLELKSTTTFIQRRYRTKLEARQLRKRFVNLREIVVKMQSRIRGNQARLRFKELQTPENLELRKQHKAARCIQAAYRGYRERNKKENRCFKVIVMRLMKVQKNLDPAQTLAAKLKTSIDFLKTGYDSNIAISFLAKIEYMSRIVPWILIEDAEFISVFCYGIMSAAIRSEVDKQIIELCSCIILNLSRYKDTQESAFHDQGLLTIAQMLLRWCDKDCGIFNTLCTLVWVFAHCKKKKRKIREFMTRDGEFILSQIAQNVARKENMRKNSRRPIGFQSISLIKYKKDHLQQLRFNPQSTAFSSGFITPEMLRQCEEVPSLEPDYGLVKTMPYIFYSSVFAFDNVLKKLEIKKA